MSLEVKVSTEELINRLPEKFRGKLLQEIKSRVIPGRKVRIYSDGCFNLFHFGHGAQLKKKKKMFDNVELIVGVSSDEDIHHYKGANIMNNKERVESLRHCKWIDQILFPVPWAPTPEFIKENNIDFVAHDVTPYVTDSSSDCYEPMKEMGRFLPTLRTEGISTSDIMVRILKDREELFERNLRKGYDRKSLKLGYFEYLYVQARVVLVKIVRCLKDHEKKQ